MADDGLLLNFAFGEGPLKSRSNLSGSTWRARRRVQKQEQHQPNEGRQIVRAEDRPLKRQKTSQSQDAPQVGQSKPAQRQEVQKPKEIISSLFSFNPTAATQAESKVTNGVEHTIEATNAPLTAEAEGLVKLGLLPKLAAHLTNKMDITAPTAIQKAAMASLLEANSDAFIQAETGSGKTLAYVLPIVQRIMQMSEHEQKIKRDSGLFALIMAPTRELSKQIYVVLESVLRCAHWIVPGIVIGGENKSSEKARLRKGVNILVATPGRLADHLEHTEVLDVSKVRWLVLDEGDRLMELGFEEDIKKIVSRLDFALKSRKHETRGLPSRRINILCSATMEMTVQRLGEISLKDAAHIQAEPSTKSKGPESETTEPKAFSAPAQLKQSYAIVPAKLRLVSLVSHLRRTFIRKGAISKTIVFMSCADTVDFHFEIFTRVATNELVEPELEPDTRSKTKQKHHPRPAPPPMKTTTADSLTSGTSPLISTPQNMVRVFKLHGSLPQLERTRTLKAFSKETDPAVLICTDVASRGLDLPNVDLVIEYDPPFSKEEHLHRIGRTARAGRDGRSTIFLLPGCEEGYIGLLKEGRQDGGIGLIRHVANDFLRKGFVIKEDGREKESGWEERATEWQLEIERWMLDTPKMLEMGRRAYQSHIRAYATHVAAERSIFDMKQLHLGHLAKAFGLRDKPGSINVPGLRQNAGKVKSGRQKAGAGKTSADDGSAQRGAVELDGDVGGDDDAEQARKMMKRKAKMMSSGASEFNLA